MTNSWYEDSLVECWWLLRVWRNGLDGYGFLKSREPRSDGLLCLSRFSPTMIQASRDHLITWSVNGWGLHDSFRGYWRIFLFWWSVISLRIILLRPDALVVNPKGMEGFAVRHKSGNSKLVLLHMLLIKSLCAQEFFSSSKHWSGITSQKKSIGQASCWPSQTFLSCQIYGTNWQINLEALVMVVNIEGMEGFAVRKRT
jgi:hypothetical protein